MPNAIEALDFNNVELRALAQANIQAAEAYANPDPEARRAAKAILYHEMYGGKPKMPELNFKFEETVLKSHPTGSRYICNPAPKDTDNDTVMLVNGFYDWQQALLNDGWEQCGDYEFGGQFNAFRKGQENYIVTEDEDFFNRYIFATEAARSLNLLVKDDRIKLFQAVANASLGAVGFRVIDPLIPVPAFNQIAEFEMFDEPANEPAGQWVFEDNILHWQRAAV